MDAKVSRRKFLWSILAAPVAAKLAPAIKLLPAEPGGKLTIETMADGWWALKRYDETPDYIYVPYFPLNLSGLIQSYQTSHRLAALAAPLARCRNYQTIARECLHVEPLPKGAFEYADYRASVQNEG